MITTTSRLRTVLAASSMLIVGGILLAGCASATEQNQAASTTQPSTDQQMPQTPAGVSGLIAYSEDGLLQVQGDDEQTAVRYTNDTTVTKTVSVDAATIVVGDCVTIVTDEDGTTATSVTVSDAAEDGTCSLGFGGGFPGGDGEAPTGGEGDGERQDGAPSGMPTDAPEGAGGAEGTPGGFGQFISGAVTAVDEGALTVESTGFGDDAETTTTDVTVSDDTAVTGTVAATTADIATGLCVTARGEADDAGGYDATSLALSDPDDDGECGTGLGGGFPGGGNGFLGTDGTSGDDTEDSE
ncbi:hypothetical protein ACWGJP_13025 [Microbacterium sp. NPDC055903]